MPRQVRSHRGQPGGRVPIEASRGLQGSILRRRATRLANYHLSCFSYLLSAFFRTLVITFGPAPLLARKAGEHDEDPYEPEQCEECNASSSPIDCAKYIKTQTNKTGRAKDTVDARVNSHR